MTFAIRLYAADPVVEIHVSFTNKIIVNCQLRKFVGQRLEWAVGGLSPLKFISH